MQVIDAADGPVTPGTVASKSTLAGGQFNTALPTLTNTQQAALQVDSSGRLIVAPLTNSSIVKAQLQDNNGAAIVLGQTTMSASVPVVVASDQSAIPTSHTDVVPATQTITALDTGTSNLTGANGQVFYFGTPTANSAATFALSSIENVTLQANLLGAGGTMVVEISMDGGTFWLRPNVFQTSTQNYTNGFTAPFIATLNVAGCTHVRVRATVSWAGTATIIVRESINAKSVLISDALPPGTNAIGAVTQSGTWNINNVSGTISLPTGAATSANQTTEITSLQLIDNIIGPVTPGTVATNSALVGGQFNTALPTLTNTQQASMQLDSSGRLIIAPLTNTSVVKAQLQDNAGTAIVLGQTTMASSLPVAIASNQSALQVVGNVASGASDSGNPVKTGGVFNSTAPTLTTGQRGDSQLDAKARTIVLDIANLGTGTQVAISVTTTATEVRVGGARLANRCVVTAYNNGAQPIFWGYTSGVTTTSGTPLAVGQVGSWKVGDQQSVYLIATSGTQNVRVTEA